MKLVYPAILTPCEEGGYTVEVPDLPGCISEGDTLADAILMGTDAASGWILGEWEDGKEVPAPSSPDQLDADKESLVSMLVLDMDTYAEKYGSKHVRKNCSIPAYMNTYLETHDISLSQLVQDAIAAKMNPSD